jgi:hypothetical protein
MKSWTTIIQLIFSTSLTVSKVLRSQQRRARHPNHQRVCASVGQACIEKGRVGNLADGENVNLGMPDIAIPYNYDTTPDEISD